MRKQQSSQFDQGASAEGRAETAGVGRHASVYAQHGPESSWRHGQEPLDVRHEHGDAGYGFEAPRRWGDEHRFAHRSYPGLPQQGRHPGTGGATTEHERQQRAYEPPTGEWGNSYPRPVASEGYGGYSRYPSTGETAGNYGSTRRARRLMPRGYKRSDERLREDICERMIASDLEIGDVEVNVHDGCVTISGTVPQRWVKHLLEDLVEQCSGVADIDNRLRIQGVGDRSGTESYPHTGLQSSAREQGDKRGGSDSDDGARH